VTATIAERVEKGAAWLDEHRPGWVDRIDLETLDLGDPCRCVLGQQFEPQSDSDQCGFEVGMRLLTTPGNDPVIPLVEQGFYATSDDNYADLTAAWRELIERRRSA
jgi:hypothetical protein